MNVGPALELVLCRLGLPQHQLAQLSGVSASSIRKVLDGKLATLPWDDVEKIANGLEKVDPLAVGAFYFMLIQPQRFLYQAGILPKRIYEESDDSDDNERGNQEMVSESAGEQNPNAKLKVALAKLWRLQQEIESLVSRTTVLREEVNCLNEEVMNCSPGAYGGFLDPFEPTVIAVIDGQEVRFWSLTNLEGEEDAISR